MEYTIGYMFGSLVFGAIFGFFAYCIVQGKTKSRKKGMIAFVLAMLIVASIKCFVFGDIQLFNNNDSSSSIEATEDEKVEPRYCEFGDLKVQTNCNSNIYTEIENYKELSFEYEDGDGEVVDWSDKEKKEVWDSFKYSEPYKTKLIQSLVSSDIISLSRLPKGDCIYDNIDSIANNVEGATKRKDFNIGDIHACTLYYTASDDKTEEPVQAEILFFYKENLYSIIVSPLLGDLETNINEFVETVVLN